MKKSLSFSMQNIVYVAAVAWSLLTYVIQFIHAQKLIAYDHLEGDPGLEGGKNAQLFTEILNMICNCVDNSSPDRYVYVNAFNSQIYFS